MESPAAKIQIAMATFHASKEAADLPEKFLRHRDVHPKERPLTEEKGLYRTLFFNVLQTVDLKNIHFTVLCVNPPLKGVKLLKSAMKTVNADFTKTGVLSMLKVAPTVPCVL